MDSTGNKPGSGQGGVNIPSAKGGSGDVPNSASPLQVVQQVLQRAWADVQEDLQRLNAHLPARASSLQGHQPWVSSTTSSKPDAGSVLEVVIPVRPGANTQAVLSELLSTFRGASSSTQAQRMGTSQTVQLEVLQAPVETDAVNIPACMVRAQLYVPPAGSQGGAQLTVRKSSEGGKGQPSFTQQELAGLAQLVKTANLSFSSSPAGSPAGQEEGAPGEAGAAGRWRSTKSWSTSDWEDVRRHGLDSPPDLQSFMRQLQSDPFGSFFGGMVAGGIQQMMDEVERLMQQQAEDGFDGEPQQQQPNGGFFTFRFPPGGAGDMVDQNQGEWQVGPYQAGRRAREQAGPEGDEHDWGSPQAAAAVNQLRALGAQVFPPGSKDRMDWGVLAGYEAQKRLLEDCLLLPLQRPEVYEQLAAATRANPGSNRPRAVLFEGPPGTGKTTSARVISSQAAVPLVYLPLEAVLSKWYGESEGQLAKVFKAAAALGGAIIFIDELDALGGSRERGDLHEASRRLLSVLLREMDGFDASGKRAVVVGATNRKADLDPALLSRFDMSITFGLPDEACRAKILAKYARQLPEADLRKLAKATPGMSGRDLRDVCEMTERRYASKIIRGEAAEGGLPSLAEYQAAAKERLASLRHERDSLYL